jgi:hypothetical protein
MKKKKIILICRWCCKEFSEDSKNFREICPNTISPHVIMEKKEWEAWRNDLTDEQFYRLLRRERMG